MKFSSDWHIHTRNSCDSASLVVSELIPAAQALGIEAFGITDHIHTPYNLPDLVASRREFDESEPPPNFHFGVEVSCVSQWELDEIATGKHANPVYGLRTGGPAGGPPPSVSEQRSGSPWRGVRHRRHALADALPADRDAIICDYHRQNLFLATHPLVTLWRTLGGGWATGKTMTAAIGATWIDDWEDTRLMHDGLPRRRWSMAPSWSQHQRHSLQPAYPEAFGRHAELLAGLKGAGPPLGSDCHSPRYTATFERAASLEAVGIRDEELWRMLPRS